jgi:hypothetical protein
VIGRFRRHDWNLGVEEIMLNAIVLALGSGFFALTLAYLSACDRL